MALTSRLKLLTGTKAGTVVGPTDWDLLNSCVDNLAGRPATDLHSRGVLSGWKLDAETKTILPGKGWLGDGLRAETTTAQAITGLQAGVTTYIWATPTQNTASTGEVAFVAQGSRPADGVLLHKVTTDASGNITAVNGGSPGQYDYSADADIVVPMVVTALEGTADLGQLEVGQRYRVTIDHSASGVFALAAHPWVAEQAGIAVRVLADGTDGGKFSLEVEVLAAGERYVSSGGDYTVYAWDTSQYGYSGPATLAVMLSWQRRGVLLPGTVGTE